ncbi:transcriptional repressor [Litoricola sp.]|nr:transcriptional repressor [Litorivicinus sp.]
MAIDNETFLNRLTAQRKTLTPQRLQIYRVLEDGGEPLTAYELQERVNRTFDESLNISTIYRVLDFWTTLGYIHKIDSANKFVTCTDEHTNHIHILQYCTKCQRVEESCEISRLIKMPANTEFEADINQVIEVLGRCANCQD